MSVSSDYVKSLAAIVSQDNNNKIVFVEADSPTNNFNETYLLTYATITKTFGVKSSVSTEPLNTIQLYTITSSFDETYIPSS